VFDVEIRNENAYTSFMLLAPRRVPHEQRGCVVMMFDPSKGGDPVVAILTVAHDEACSAPDTPPLEKKYGTRAMMLGSVHAMMFLARTRWPHLASFQLDDESTFPCMPLDKKVRTFAADLLLQDRTYYDRHLNAKPLHPFVKRTTADVFERMKRPVDMTGSEFAATMGDGTFAKPVASWMAENMPDVADTVDLHRESGSSWRSLFTALSGAYGCAFFACCTTQLIDLFNMNRLLGAAYGVRFEASGVSARGATAAAPLTIDVRMLQDGGDGGSRNARRCALALRRRLGAMRASAMWDRMHG
jgi:hypothetical protein